MTNIKIWGWDKKPRTMRRFIKLGDIFAFRYSEAEYGFGMVIGGDPKNGHMVQLLDIFQAEPNLTPERFLHAAYLLQPLVINSYSLFDRCLEGQWRMIGHQDDLDLTPFADTAFYFGAPDGHFFSKMNLDGQILGRDFSREEIAGLQNGTPIGDFEVKRLIKQELEGRKQDET